MDHFLYRRRLLKFLYNIFVRSTAPKKKTHFLQEFRRNFSYGNVSARNSAILCKINLARFYNGTTPLDKVSTYQNLVKQKSTGGDTEKCGDGKEHPGRHRFHNEVEAALNDQIQMEFTASFTYLSMASYFGRSDVALPGLQGFFMLMHAEEHEHAVILLNYVLMRGGYVRAPTICAPENDNWKDIGRTLEFAVQMEASVKEKLEELVELSDKQHDHQLSDFISGDFLEEQNRSIQTISRLLTRSKMVDSDVGEYLFDQHIYDSFVKKNKGNLMYKTHLEHDEHKEVYK